MSSIEYKDTKCANCGKSPVAWGLPVFKDLSAEGKGQSGAETVVWCKDCIIQELHKDFG